MSPSLASADAPPYEFALPDVAKKMRLSHRVHARFVLRGLPSLDRDAPKKVIISAWELICICILIRRKFNGFEGK